MKNFYFKMILTSFISFAAIFGIFLITRNRIDSRTSDTLIIGIMSGYAPYALTTDTGGLEGFDIDVANLIGKKLNKKIVFKDMGLAALLIALQQNSIDILISGLCITQDRLSVMDMIYYQGEPTTEFPLAFWQKIPTDITSIDDILTQNPSAVICAEPGSAQEKFLLAQYPQLQLKSLSSMSDIILDLKYGKSYAALLDPEVAPTLKKQNPELIFLTISLPKDFQTAGCGIAINKNNPTLSKAVASIINEFQKDETLKQLERRWFPQV
jgi:polar amino acid transport system substrate-binding protein